MGGVVQEIYVLSWTARGQHKLTLHITLKAKWSRTDQESEGRQVSSVSLHSSRICTELTQTTGLPLHCPVAPQIKEENITPQDTFNSYIVIQEKKDVKGNKPVRNFKMTFLRTEEIVGDRSQELTLKEQCMEKELTCFKDVLTNV